MKRRAERRTKEGACLRRGCLPISPRKLAGLLTAHSCDSLRATQPTGARLCSDKSRGSDFWEGQFCDFPSLAINDCWHTLDALLSLPPIHSKLCRGEGTQNRRCAKSSRLHDGSACPGFSLPTPLFSSARGGRAGREVRHDLSIIRATLTTDPREQALLILPLDMPSTDPLLRHLHSPLDRLSLCDQGNTSLSVNPGAQPCFKFRC